MDSYTATAEELAKWMRDDVVNTYKYDGIITEDACNGCGKPFASSAERLIFCGVPVCSGTDCMNLV